MTQYPKYIEQFWRQLPKRISGASQLVDAATPAPGEARDKVQALVHLLKGETMLLKQRRAARLLTAMNTILRLASVPSVLSDEEASALHEGFGTLALMAGDGSEFIGMDAFLDDLDELARLRSESSPTVNITGGTGRPQ